ncbi:MAG: radical SAM protein [Clostridia bacterium]|nr:radical SAM protein [Clostridia bacterium]
MSECNICPRRCGADREKSLGFCQAPGDIYIARAALHMYEEPCISGERGSGTIFFYGCNMRCVYCQNGDISRITKDMLERHSERCVDEDGLCRIMFSLRDRGAHNINLVTPTHYADRIASVLSKAKSSLGIPVVYNCGGYESVETLRRLDGLIDIYMPDIKYFSSEISKKYSSAPDYIDAASMGLEEMFRQTGEAVIGEDGLMRKGVLVRHLVLPGLRHDSAAVLKRISETVPSEKILISIMRQYTPDFAPAEMRELKRKITSFEYDSVIREAEKYGFCGFSQEKESARADYTPDFNEKTF